MHHYLIDERATRSAKQRQVEQIRSWIKTSRIAGEQTTTKSPQHLVEMAKKVAGATSPTLIVIGDDLSLDLAITALHTIKHEVTLGYIPLDIHSASSTTLELTSWQQACKALIKGKRRPFSLIAIEDYTILSGVELLPKIAPTDIEAVALRATLNDTLQLVVPAVAHLTIESLAHEPQLQEDSSNFLLTGKIDDRLEKKIKSMKPIVPLTNVLKQDRHRTFLRLKAGNALLKAATPLLLNGVIQLRTDIVVRGISRRQQLIVGGAKNNLV